MNSYRSSATVVMNTAWRCCPKQNQPIQLNSNQTEVNLISLYFIIRHERNNDCLVSTTGTQSHRERDLDVPLTQRGSQPREMTQTYQRGSRTETNQQHTIREVEINSINDTIQNDQSEMLQEDLPLQQVIQ